MSTRPNILVIGLGPNVKLPSSTLLPANLSPSTVGAAVKASMQKIKDAGFDLTATTVSPGDTDDDLSTLEKLLTEKEWTGIVVGFGIRGTPEFTEMFETAVQMCWRLRPGVKVGFNSRPDDLYEAVVRNFGGKQ